MASIWCSKDPDTGSFPERRVGFVPCNVPLAHSPIYERPSAWGLQAPLTDLWEGGASRGKTIKSPEFLDLLNSWVREHRGMLGG